MIRTMMTTTTAVALLGAEHVFRSDAVVEVVGRHEAEVQRGLTQCEVLVVGVLGNAFRGVVAEHRVQSGDQHQRLGHMASDALAIRNDACDINTRTLIIIIIIIIIVEFLSLQCFDTVGWTTGRASGL